MKDALKSMKKIFFKQDFVKIAQGAPHTNKQRLKYKGWEFSNQFHFDNRFMQVPSNGRLMYEVSKGNDQWLIDAKSSFNFYQWMEASPNSTVNLEICSGFGQWFCQTVKEASHSDERWIACEIKFRRCMSILGRMEHYLDKTDHSRVICGNAQFVLEHFFPSFSLDNVHIRFPEPWTNYPQKRIVNVGFILLLAQVVKRSGRVIITTDDLSFRDGTLDAFYQVRELWKQVSVVTEQKTMENGPEEEFGEGGFESMLKERGYQIHVMTFARI